MLMRGYNPSADIQDFRCEAGGGIGQRGLKELPVSGARAKR